MIRLALARLLSAFSLAVGVSLLLFLLFDSGLLGDPALREAGKHADADAIGRARERLGQFTRYQPGAVRLELRGPAARFTLESDGERLLLRDVRGAELGWVGLEDRRVGQLAELLPLPPPWALGAEAADPELPASGLAAALRGGRAVLDSRGPLALGWAEASPAWRHFLRQTSALLRFDFGRTRDDRPVAQELWLRGRRSLALALPAFVLTTALALATALLCAARGGWFDRLLAWLSVGAMSGSSLVWVMLLQRWLGGGLAWFPVHGWEPPYAAYLALPVLIWIVVGFGPELRFYRAAAIEESGRPYLRTARAKGLGRGAALRRHLLPNLLLPLLTQVVVSLPFLMLGSLLLERFFGIPGLGDWTVRAVLDNDQQVIRATTFLFALLYLAAQWLTDLAYALADPRVRRAV
ncbi:MAG: ABC transporter permease [Planctomycetes bacterium]|nr:ABC transporter permease [Planctomycetota bacterium]